MGDLHINDEVLRLLEDRARVQHCDVDELVRNLLASTLPASKEFYSEIVSHTSDIITLFDRRLRHLYVNSPIEAITGIPAPDMIGKTDRELGLSPALVDFWERALQTVIDTRQAQVFLLELLQGCYEFHLTPIFDVNGEVDHIVSIARETTSHYQQAMLDNYKGAAWVVDRQYRLIASNAVFNRNLEMTFGRKPLPGENILNVNLPPEFLAMWRVYYDRALQGERFSVELRTQFRTAIPHDVEYHLAPIHNAMGEIMGVSIFSSDITERKRGEEQLRRSEANLRAMLNSSSQSFTLIDRDYRIIDAAEESKRSSQAIFGRTMQPGDSIYDFVLERDHASFTENFQRAISGERVIVEKAFETRQGAPLYFEVLYYPVVDDQGETMGVCMAFQNVTARKLAEERLRQSEARLRSLLDTQSAFVVRCDLEGNHTYYNQAYADKYSWMGKDLIGISLLETVIPEDHGKALAAGREAIMQPGKPVQVVLRKPIAGGDYFWTLWEFVGIADAEGSVSELQCMGFDITGQKKAEESLRRSEARLRSLMESQTALIVRTDLEGNFTYVSPSWIKRFGWMHTHFIGANSLDTIYHEDHEKAFMGVAQCMSNPGEVVQLTLRKPNSDGSLMWTLWEFVAIQDERGEVNEIQCVGVDISEQIQAEQMRLEQERLKASLKKEREFNTLVQKAVSVLAHDIRTPLTVIANARDMLERYFDRLDEEKRQEKLESINRQLHYVLMLLNDMSLTVKGKLDDHRFQPILLNLEALCEVTISELKYTIGSKHQLRFLTDEHIHSAFVDETLVSRILLNLLSNAIKFSPPASEIELLLSRHDDWIVLRVTDHGMGISEDDLHHIFEPFYRAEAVSRIDGTGLGLNIVQDCVTRHQGRISVQSQLGQGTVFTVELPLRTS